MAVSHIHDISDDIWNDHIAMYLSYHQFHRLAHTDKRLRHLFLRRWLGSGSLYLNHSVVAHHLFRDAFLRRPDLLSMFTKLEVAEDALSRRVDDIVGALAAGSISDLKVSANGGGRLGYRYAEPISHILRAFKNSETLQKIDIMLLSFSSRPGTLVLSTLSHLLLSLPSLTSLTLRVSTHDYHTNLPSSTLHNALLAHAPNLACLEWSIDFAPNMVTTTNHLRSLLTQFLSRATALSHLRVRFVEGRAGWVHTHVGDSEWREIRSIIRALASNPSVQISSLQIECAYLYETEAIEDVAWMLSTARAFSSLRRFVMDQCVIGAEGVDVVTQAVRSILSVKHLRISSSNYRKGIDEAISGVGDARYRKCFVRPQALPKKYW
ncbi:hypothetical protein BJ742DRAFT_333621 [Cladochytrium replicatum]|nr:hypothetical protein BJ742DRAFT_333621 [Cladochytrium replicatum]